MNSPIEAPVRDPINASDAKFLAAVVEGMQCAYLKLQDDPEALKESICSILSEDDIGQTVANVINAAA
jgi:hypothetical protein